MPLYLRMKKRLPSGLMLLRIVVMKRNPGIVIHHQFGICSYPPALCSVLNSFPTIQKHFVS